SLLPEVVEEEVLQGHLRRHRLRGGGCGGEDAQLGALGQGFHVGHQVVGQEVVGGLPGDQAGPHSGGGGGQQVLYRPLLDQGPLLEQKDLPGDVLHVGDDV